MATFHPVDEGARDELVRATVRDRLVAIEAAATRLCAALGREALASRVQRVDRPEEDTLDGASELRVDDVPVWVGMHRRTGEYTFQWEARWLVDPERFGS